MNRLLRKKGWRYVAMVLVLTAFCGATAWATTPEDHQARQTRPIPLGVSGGSIDNYDAPYCCGGTLGGLLEDAGGTLYIVSNNHVLGRVNRAVSGEDAVQPALIEVGCSKILNDVVADFTEYILLDENSSTNKVDAAISQIRTGAVDESGTILDIGAPSTEVLDAYVGLNVQKSGRTTGHTYGQVEAVDVAVTVQYSTKCGRGRMLITFDDQFRITPGDFSDSGDSGSLIVEDVAGNPRAVGLLFAGSSSYTLANRIQNVLSAGWSVGTLAMSGGEAPPDCTTNADCIDDNECTTDTCVDGVCYNTAVADNTTCSGGICCGGTCAAAVCSVDGDCNDSEACTADACSNSGTCSAYCTSTWAACGLADGCCGPDCDSSNDPDCEATPCGDTVCDIAAGEDCRNCPQDCNGVTTGRPSGRYCCGDDVDCSDPRCTGGGNTCAQGATASDPPGWARRTIPQVSAIKGRHSERLFAIPDVVGHGITLAADGSPVIEVYLAKENPNARAQIPAALQGVPVRVLITGPFEAR